MVILLNGSPRKRGATGRILEYLSQQLEQKGIETRLIHVSDLDLRYCSGCCRCYTTGHCIFGDDLEQLSLTIKQADGLIIGSPTYASNISGQLKTVIDRGHFVIEQLLHKKLALSVVTYENYGGKDTAKILNRLFLYSGALVQPSLLFKIPFSHDPLEHLKVKSKIDKAAARFCKSLQASKNTADLNNHKPARIIQMVQAIRHFFVHRRIQAVQHFFIFRCGIVPFVRRKGESYAGVIAEWKRKQLL